MQAREPEHFFDATWVHLKDGSALYVQRATERQGRYAGMWFIFWMDVPEHLANVLAKHCEMEELEAQATFDHYTRTYGLEEHCHDVASHP